MIEKVISGSEADHDFEDMSRSLGDGTQVLIEIKTKLLAPGRSSNPKAYNIDKVLEVFSRGNSVAVFLFVGINEKQHHVAVRTVSILDSQILNATRIQFHWAGRNSRGVTQLTGNLTALFSATYEEQIDVARAQQFLQELIDL